METFHPEVKYGGIPISVVMQEYMIYCSDVQVKHVVRISLMRGNFTHYMSI